jgi:hypothetical protein
MTRQIMNWRLEKAFDTQGRNIIGQDNSQFEVFFPPSKTVFSDHNAKPSLIFGGNSSATVPTYPLHGRHLVQTLGNGS